MSTLKKKWKNGGKTWGIILKRLEKLVFTWTVQAKRAVSKNVTWEICFVMLW